jgi:predicted membrane channel-forming protein YqfA (hemolysin III family)
MYGNREEPPVSATTKAIAAVVIFAAIQLALLLYSFSHPWINDIVTSSFLLSIVFYLAVFDYHTRKMRAAGKRRT